MSSQTGTLYVVATPIGNADDISLRARTVLADVALVAAEDTRRTARLFERLGIRAELVSCHEHNEAERAVQLLERLQSGDDIALVSDAGTPLVSDPGYRLVGMAAAAGVSVSPVPGCSAAMAALSIAGLPTDAVLFVGFLPATESKRRAALEKLVDRTETLVIYESVHRIGACLDTLALVMGSDRPLVAARELTKLHETVYRGSIDEVSRKIDADSGGGKGEYTLVLGGAPERETDSAEIDRALTVLLGYLGVRQAADAVAKLLKVKKNAAYKRALELREGSDGDY